MNKKNKPHITNLIKDILTIIIYTGILILVIIYIRNAFFTKYEKENPDINNIYIYLQVVEPVDTSIKLVNHETEQSIISTDIDFEALEHKRKIESQYKSFTITAYNDAPQSQGKWLGQTATGFDLKNHTLESARCIAVDPKVIPLHSKVEIIFSEPYEHLSGVYNAYDTGGSIKGNKIDLFMGDETTTKKCFEFGVRDAKVRILE